MKEPVLIVDDEPDMCWVMHHILESQGYDVVSVMSGEDAIALLAKRDFAFVLLDAKLSDVDGLELARNVQLPREKKLGIVLVSGYHYHDDLDIRCAIRDGIICAFLAKPFTQADLLASFPTGHL
jgi:CheY-like chemotaxis protein